MTPLFLANVVVDTFLHGGIIMWPLLGLSLFAIGVIAERIIWWTAAKRRRDSGRLTRTYEALSRGDREEAIKLAEASADPRLRVIAYGLVHPESGVEIAMEVRATEELKLARRFLNAMDTIITLAPLLGLLGTVTGIMQSFKFVGGDQELAAAKVSGGIGEALIATACGLGIAIATLLPFNLFGGHAEELREEIETVSKNVHLLAEKARPPGREKNYENAGAAH
jgi:biopolymer transport protein ExbB